MRLPTAPQLRARRGGQKRGVASASGIQGKSATSEGFDELNRGESAKTPCRTASAHGHCARGPSGPGRCERLPSQVARNRSLVYANRSWACTVQRPHCRLPPGSAFGLENDVVGLASGLPWRAACRAALGRGGRKKPQRRGGRRRKKRIYRPIRGQPGSNSIGYGARSPCE